MVRGQDIAAIIKQQIEQYGASIAMVEVGTVVEVGDGIARIHGLTGVKYGELVEFPGNVLGMALNLEEETVGVVILGEDRQIKEGDEVRSTSRVAEVPVGRNSLAGWWTHWGSPWTGRGLSGPRRAVPSSVWRPTW